MQVEGSSRACVGRSLWGESVGGASGHIIAVGDAFYEGFRENPASVHD